MEIILSKYCGYCSGVKRAVKILENTLNMYGKNSSVYTFGDIIHNPKVIRDYEKKGVFPVDDINKLKSGDYLVIRSHGVSPEIIEKLNEKGINVINGTCPSVLKVHKLAAQLSSSGYFIVLIGDKSHPEVNGIKGNIVSQDYKIINSVSEAKKINSLKKIAVLSQTTQTLKNFILISQEIVKKIKDEVLIINTLCNATEQRQIEINELSKKVDVMIIVGGRNSANTTHLAQISKNILNETYHIENASELKKEWFKNAKIAGLGGGASTPAEDIDEVKKIIQSI